MTVCPCIAQYITDSFRSQSQNQPTGRGKDNRARGATGGRRYVLGLSQIPTLFAHTRLTLSFIYLSVRADFRETRRYLPAGFHQLPLPFRKTWGGGVQEDADESRARRQRAARAAASAASGHKFAPTNGRDGSLDSWPLDAYTMVFGSQKTALAYARWHDWKGTGLSSYPNPSSLWRPDYE